MAKTRKEQIEGLVEDLSALEDNKADKVDVGDKDDLTTTDKSNLVGAINEVNGNIPDVTGFVPYTGANQPVNLNTQSLLTNGVISKTTGETVINLAARVVASNQSANSIVLEVKGSGNSTLMGTYSFELFRYIGLSYKFNINSYFFNHDWYSPSINWISGNSNAISAINFLKKSTNEYYIEIVFNSKFSYMSAKVDWLGNLPALSNEFNLYRGSRVDLTTSTISFTRIPSQFTRDSYLLDYNNFTNTPNLSDYALQSWVNSNFATTNETNNIYDQLSAKANDRLSNVASNLSQSEKDALLGKIGATSEDWVTTQIEEIELTPGPQGDKPAHQWSGTSVRFENPNGSWGTYVNLKGDDGSNGSTWYNGVSNPTTQGVVGDWYINTSTWDVYRKISSNSWNHYGNIKGDKGEDGVVDYSVLEATGYSNLIDSVSPTNTPNSIRMSGFYVPRNIINTETAVDGISDLHVSFLTTTEYEAPTADNIFNRICVRLTDEAGVTNGLLDLDSSINKTAISNLISNGKTQVVVMYSRNEGFQGVDVLSPADIMDYKDGNPAHYAIIAGSLHEESGIFTMSVERQII